MKLYYAPGSCALSPHIVAREAGLPVELSRITFEGPKRTTAEGEDFLAINPHGGYVPALRLDDGEVIAEGPAIIQYLADQSPDKKLVPEQGSRQYYRMLSWVAFVSTEVHKAFSPLFGEIATPELKAAVHEKLAKRYAVLESALGQAEYLVGTFSIADAYCYTILRWSPRADLNLSDYPNISKFVSRMEARPAVQTGLKEEGLEPMLSS